MGVTLELDSARGLCNEFPNWCPTSCSTTWGTTLCSSPT